MASVLMSGNLLQDFLAEQVSSKSHWGKNDCVMTAANWVKSRTGVDLAIEIRGKYHSWKEALELTRERGGLLNAVSDVFAAAGIETTDDPLTGDVGVVKDEGTMIIAIRAGKLWCARGVHGIIAKNFELVKAWRIP